LGPLSLGDNALDDIANGAPRDAHNLGHCCFVGNLGHISGHLLKWPGKPTVGSGPRDHLHKDAAIGAFDAPWSVFKNEPGFTDSQMNPAYRLMTVVVARADLSASRTARFAPRRLQRKYETMPIEVDAGDEKTGNPDKNSGKLGDAHDFLSVLGSL